MSKAAVPAVSTGQAQLDQFAAAVKQNMDQMTGQQKNAVKLTALKPTATLADVITLTNALLNRLQG